MDIKQNEKNFDNFNSSIDDQVAVLRELKLFLQQTSEEQSETMNEITQELETIENLEKNIR